MPRLELLETRCLLSPYLVTTTAPTGTGSLSDAINQINADTSGQYRGSHGVDEIDFALPWNDPGHVYYKDDGVSGKISLANVTPVPVGTSSDADLANAALVGTGNTIDPDWSHSWWSIDVDSLVPGVAVDLPVITNAVFIDGYSQPGASPNTNPTLAQGDNAVLRVEVHGPSVSDANYLLFDSANLTIQGMVLNRGGALSDLGLGFSVGDQVLGNFIGTDISGTASFPNESQ